MEIASIIIAVITLVISVVSIIYSTAYKKGEFDKRVQRLEMDMEHSLNELRALHDSMIRVHTVLQIKMKGVDTIFSVKNSPRTLNALGQKLFDEMDGKQFILENKERFFDGIDKQQPKTALDVENVSLFVCTTLASDDIFNPIKKFVYNCPTQKDANGNDVEFTLEDACFVISIPLRDAYLQEHKEIQ
jgi:hypothetical protein